MPTADPSKSPKRFPSMESSRSCLFRVKPRGAYPQATRTVAAVCRPVSGCFCAIKRIFLGDEEMDSTPGRSQGALTFKIPSEAMRFYTFGWARRRCPDTAASMSLKKQGSSRTGCSIAEVFPRFVWAPNPPDKVRHSQRVAWCQLHGTHEGTTLGQFLKRFTFKKGDFHAFLGPQTQASPVLSAGLDLVVPGTDPTGNLLIGVTYAFALESTCPSDRSPESLSISLLSALVAEGRIFVSVNRETLGQLAAPRSSSGATWRSREPHSGSTIVVQMPESR